MADTKANQADSSKTPAEQQSEQDRERRDRADQASSAAAKVLQLPQEEAAVNPFPAYDLLSLDQLRALASERGVAINPDVEKAHLITTLRAADTGNPTVAERRGAR